MVQLQRLRFAFGLLLLTTLTTPTFAAEMDYGVCSETIAHLSAEAQKHDHRVTVEPYGALYNAPGFKVVVSSDHEEINPINIAVPGAFSKEFILMKATKEVPHNPAVPQAWFGDKLTYETCEQTTTIVEFKPTKDTPKEVGAYKASVTKEGCEAYAEFYKQAVILDRQGVLRDDTTFKNDSIQVKRADVELYGQACAQIVEALTIGNRTYAAEAPIEPTLN